MSLKFKLWLQGLLPVLAVTILGAIFILWVTIVQQQKFIMERHGSNLGQFEWELKSIARDMDKTLFHISKNSKIIQSAKSLFKIKGSIPELKRTAQCEIASDLRRLVIDKNYIWGGVFSNSGPESYATKTGIFAVSTDEDNLVTEHYTPAAESVFSQCPQKKWIVTDDNPIVPVSLRITDNQQTLFTLRQGRIIVEGILPVEDLTYVDGMEKRDVAGAVFIETQISKVYVMEFSRKTSMAIDIFSPTGAILAGSHSQEAPIARQTIDAASGGDVFTTVSIGGIEHYATYRAFTYDGKPTLILAVYSPKEVVSENIRSLSMLQLGGLIFGLLVAAIITIIYEKIISRPIRQVTSQMDNIADKRQFDQRIDVSSHDEIGRLAESFNKMASMLEQSQREADKHAGELFKTNKLLAKERKSLEIEVQKRTLELTKAKDAAEAGARVKSDFLANMSHEIRTPMTAILGFTRLLMLESGSGKYSQYTHNILDSAESLLRIIDDILDFSKMEANKLGIENIQFSLNDVISSTVNMVTGKAEEKGLELRISIAENIPNTLIGDPVRIGQILSNLISNAIKFTSQGEVSLTVTLNTLMENEAVINFAIKDTGIGISQEQLASLFQPFMQADISMTRKYGGAGLGLVISKRLVEMMGGTINVSSTPDEGSVFWFSLPLATRKKFSISASRSNDSKTEKTKHEKAGAEEASRPGLQVERYWSPSPEKINKLKQADILLVEDNSINRQVVSSFLENWSMNVTMAKNGMEALDKLESTKFDAILMDIQMPVLDGPASAKKIRANSKFDKMPIIALTAHALVGDRERFMACGMDDYLTKPIKPELLFKSLYRWIHREEKDEDEVLSGVISPQDTTKAINIPKIIEGFDVQHGLELTNGDTRMYFHLLNLFRTSHLDAAERVEKAVASDDLDTARAITHSVKGAAGNLAAKKIYAAARNLEEMILEKQDTSGAISDFKIALDEARISIMSLDVNLRPEQDA